MVCISFRTTRGFLLKRDATKADQYVLEFTNPEMAQIEMEGGRKP